MRPELSVSIVANTFRMEESNNLWAQKLREIPDLYRYELVEETLSPGNFPNCTVITRKYKLIPLQEMNS